MTSADRRRRRAASQPNPRGLPASTNSLERHMMSQYTTHNLTIGALRRHPLRLPLREARHSSRRLLPAEGLLSVDAVALQQDALSLTDQPCAGRQREIRNALAWRDEPLWRADFLRCEASSRTRPPTAPGHPCVGRVPHGRDPEATPLVADPLQTQAPQQMKCILGLHRALSEILRIAAVCSKKVWNGSR